MPRFLGDMNMNTSTCSNPQDAQEVQAKPIKDVSRLERETAWLRDLGFEVNPSLRDLDSLENPMTSYSISLGNSLKALIAPFTGSHYALSYGFEDDEASEPFWFLAFPSLPTLELRTYAKEHGLGLSISKYGVAYFIMRITLNLETPTLALSLPTLTSIISFDDLETYFVVDGDLMGIFSLLPLDISTRLSPFPLQDAVSIRYLVTKPDLILAADCELCGLGLDYAKDTGKFYVKVPVTYVADADAGDAP